MQGPHRAVALHAVYIYHAIACLDIDPWFVFPCYSLQVEYLCGVSAFRTASYDVAASGEPDVISWDRFERARSPIRALQRSAAPQAIPKATYLATSIYLERSVSSTVSLHLESIHNSAVESGSEPLPRALSSRQGAEVVMQMFVHELDQKVCGDSTHSLAETLQYYSFVR